MVPTFTCLENVGLKTNNCFCDLDKGPGFFKVVDVLRCWIAFLSICAVFYFLFLACFIMLGDYGIDLLGLSLM
jgi:hypothetical protein